MIDIQNNNGYGLEDPGLALLKQVAQKYCPEEFQASRKAVLPDEVLDLSQLAVLYDAAFPHPAGHPSLPQDEKLRTGELDSGIGFGIGIPETQKLRNLNYEETDTLNSEQIKRDFPVLQQKVNGHDLVWLDNGATTQKPNQVIDKISHYYRTYNSNIHRGAHTLAARATDAYEEARERCSGSSMQPPARRLSLCVAPPRASTSWHKPTDGSI